MNRLWRLGWVLSLGTCLVCCRSSRSKRDLCFDSINVTTPAGTQQAQGGLGDGELQSVSDGIRAQLGTLAPACSGKERGVATMHVLIERQIRRADSGGEMRIRGRLTVTIKGERGTLGHVEEDSLGEIQVPLTSGQLGPSAEIPLAPVVELARDLVRSYVDRIAMWRLGEEGLHAILNRPDAGESRLEALQVVGAKQLRKEIPLLLQLLSDNDERIRDAALGALLSMRAREAVPVLTRTREMRDAREMRKIIDAIASLGGDEASAYLSFVAETHDDASMRELAQKALHRMEKGTGKPTTP